MSCYLACAVEPRGRRYLARGRLVAKRENATVYSSPSAAWRAIGGFLGAPNRDPRDWRFDVIDTRTGASEYGTADESHSQWRAP